MKTTLTMAAAALLVLAAAPASAQVAATDAGAPPAPKNTITANPLALAFGGFNVEYERATSENMTWFVGPSFSSASSKVGEEEITATGYGIAGGVRYFLSGTAPAGFFLSPAVSLSYATASADSGVDGSATSWSVSGIGGYTWIFGGVFDLTVGLGVGYGSLEVEVEDAKIGYTGILPTARLSLGAAF